MHDTNSAPSARDLDDLRWLRAQPTLAADAGGVNDLAIATNVSGAHGHFHTVLSRQWDIDGPASGYLGAIALRAAGRIADLPRPASIDLHFLDVPEFGEVELMVDPLKRGRRSEAFSVSLSQERRSILEAIVRTAADQQGYEHQLCEAPRMPAPETLPAHAEPDSGSPRFAFWNNIERRAIRPNDGERAVLREWCRFVRADSSDVFVDAARLLILLETHAWTAAARLYPTRYYDPASFHTSVQFHRFNAQSPWLLVEQSCPIAGDGSMSTLGRVWDREGRLLATGMTQLRCVPVRQATASG